MKEKFSLQTNEEVHTRSSRKRVIVYLSLVIIIIAIIAFVIGYFSRTTSTGKCSNEQGTIAESEADRNKLYKNIIDTLNAKNLRENLR